MHSVVRLGLAVLALAASWPARAEPAITPRPLVVVEHDGAALIIADGALILAPRNDPEADSVARYLAELARHSGVPRLVLATHATHARAIRFVRRPGFAPEGYMLDVDEKGATIAASTRAGLFYGAISLWQLLTTAPAGTGVAPVHIEDAPRFAWRGAVLDSVRHFQSPAEIARLLDAMAIHKLNRLQWHLADDQGWRLQIKRYSRLTSIGAWRSTPPAAGLIAGRYGGFYTQAEVRRLVALATARGITIVPEIEMPGHATAAILAYPKVGMTTMTAKNLGDWGVFPSIYGVDARSFTFLTNVLREVLGLFPSAEIAIGGDEAVHAGWFGSPAVQTRLHALGLADETALQAWFVRRIGAYLNAHGRRLVGWDEILTDGALPAQDIVLSWHGADGALAAARSGHDVVMATDPTLYFDHRQAAAPSEPPGRGVIIGLADIYAYDPGDPPHSPLTPPLDATSSAHILGAQAALWSEHIAGDAALEAMALPRFAALGEIDWTASGRRDWPGFVARLPAMMARYRALGLRADDGASMVQAAVIGDGTHATVTLSRQLDLGDIRYTADGTAPTPASPAYAGPFDVKLPGRVRAISFAGTQQLARELDLALDANSATRRTSQQLQLCSNRVALNLAGRPDADGKTPTFLIDIKNPCWIYRSAVLANIGHIAVSVTALPFNYQLANDPVPLKLLPTPVPAGELVVRQGCGGTVLATVPLTGVARNGTASELSAAIPPQPVPADLCLTLERPTLDPLWALGWVELRP